MLENILSTYTTFFRSLTDDEKIKVREFCDIDESKIGRGVHEEFDEVSRSVTHKVPIVNLEYVFTFSVSY